MAANLGQKSTVTAGLTLCLDAANPSSASSVNTSLVGQGFFAVSSPENSSNWQRIAAGSSNFVAINSDGTNQIAYSTDGITWTSASATQDNAWFAIAYGNGKFVMTARGSNAGNAGNVIINYASESDLSSWTGVTPSEDNDWNGVAYGNGKFVAVAGTGGTNQVMYASDSNLNSWSTASAAADSDWRDVAYGNGKFVAVAFNGTNRLMYAADSDVTSWSTASETESNQWMGVTYGDGYFVAVAQSGTNRIMYSTDGINWTAAAAPSAQYWRAVTYSSGYFVATSYTWAAAGATTSNSIMWAKSSDLSTWKLTTIEEQGRWGGIAVKEGRFVACSGSESTNRFASALTAPNKWNDVSPSKVDSTLTGSPAFDLGSYIELNTENRTQYYKMVSDYYSNVTWGANPYAIEIWVNRYDGAYLLDMRNASDSIHPYIQFNASQSNRLSYRPYNASAIFDTDTDQPSATDTTYTGWRHYVISREGTGSNECKLYYNGSFVAQGTDAETQVTPQDFDIGVRSYDDAISFKGRIGLFKIYNGKALSATEVLQNYNATKVRYD